MVCQVAGKTGGGRDVGTPPGPAPRRRHLAAVEFHHGETLQLLFLLPPTAVVVEPVAGQDAGLGHGLGGLLRFQPAGPGAVKNGGNLFETEVLQPAGGGAGRLAGSFWTEVLPGAQSDHQDTRGRNPPLGVKQEDLVLFAAEVSPVHRPCNEATKGRVHRAGGAAGPGSLEKVDYNGLVGLLLYLSPRYPNFHGIPSR